MGAVLANLLADRLQGENISILPGVSVVELVMDEGKTIGVIGFDFRRGTLIGIQSKSVVLANGGGGALFARHDNPVQTTGDGYALGYAAGCQLRDMEFIQFIPSGLAEPGRPVS